MIKSNTTAASPSQTGASSNPSAPEVVEYKLPFSLSGKAHEDTGRIYRLPSQADFYAFRSLADSLEGFTLRYNSPYDVLVWDKRVSNETMNIIKVFAIFSNTKDKPNGAATPRELYDLLHDPIFREQWDEYREEAFRVSSLSANTDIGYYAAKSPMPLVANRDFVNQRMWHDSGRDEYVIFNTSVPHSTVPPTYQKDAHHNKRGEYTRALSKLTGYLIRPWRNPLTGAVDGACLTYITQTDPSGWIPTALTNYIATKFAPNTMKNLALALPKYRVWLKMQQEAGTYVKDWEVHPEWWVEDGSDKTVKNETIEFAIRKWSEQSDKRS
ncbi:hypothetical protein JKF63_07032 [Porcisia hertigi]|uniref:START domain-containing protein n=1 Tax=Porcisia hertigi TaxID=2761500 RepID=A0A836IEY4_9TRYP|nr:hypothetical protein JKF63_07032 [Porcisia hertigi]